MPRGGPGQQKAGVHQCKTCSHPGHQEIDAMLLNGTPYPAVIRRMQQLFPEAPFLTASNLTTHKARHLLGRPITRETTDETGTRVIQTYITGAYEAQNIVIPPEAVPTLPDLASSLKIIIAAGLHNILSNPALVTPKDAITAIQELRRLGGGADELEKLLGAWSDVASKKAQMTKTAKRKRTVTVEDEVSLPEAPEVIEGEWGEADLDNLALPAPGGGSGGA